MISEIDYTLTERHFSHFKMCCMRWLKLLGLSEWDVYYLFELREDMQAIVCTNYKGLKATIILSTKWNDINLPTDDALDKTALHECIHILLAKVEASAGDRSFSHTDFEMLEHEVVNRLVKYISAGL